VLEFASFASIAFKTSLLIAAVGLLSLVMARRSAAFRHLLWLAALALALLMPLAVLYLPSQALIALPAGLPTRLMEAPDLNHAFLASAGGAVRTGMTFVAAQSNVLMTLWIVGALGLLAREALARVGLVRWVQRARPLQSCRWAASLQLVSQEQSFERVVRVLESDDLRAPCTWGILFPVLLLPAAGDGWLESVRRQALLHELTHVQRLDALGALISRIACALHWYNPLVWFAATRARHLQEQACDDAVLRAGEVPSQYAQFLVDIAAGASSLRRPSLIALGVAHHSSLRERIVAILDKRRTRSEPPTSAVVFTCLSLLGFMLLVATTAVAIKGDARSAGNAADMSEHPPRSYTVQSASPTPPEIPALPELPSLPPTAPDIAQPPDLPEPSVPPVPPTPPALPSAVL
jgi:beta-lactamase regulating signal transducer with metallopeptidase domain